jgi:hypothetical protein
VAAVIGSIFILTGAGMLIDNGSLVQVVINVVCGLLFIRAAVLSAALYRHPAWRLAVEPPNSPRAQLPANELVGNPVPERSSPSSPSPTAALDIPSGAAEPPPEGYLASFAKKRET